MKKPFFVALLVAVFVAALTVVAPARTVYIPKMMAGSAARWSEGPVGFRFPATHVAFSWQGDEGTRIMYRLVRPGGPEGTWRAAPENHDLEDGDTHYSGVLAVPRPMAVEVRSLDHVDAGEAEKITVHYMNATDGPREARVLPATAQAAATTPHVVRRAEWGADESLKSTAGGCRRLFYPLQQLFVHHTAGSNDDTDFYATMRATYYFHTRTRGWCDIGYNFVIARDGTIFEGRWSRGYGPWETPTSENRSGAATAGAHVSGYNSGSIGISLMGNFSQINVPLAARDSLVRTLAWIADRHNIDPLMRKSYRNPDTGTTRTLDAISGHRDAGTTACPGNNLYSALPKIRQQVAELIGPGRQRASIVLDAAATKLPPGEPASLSGRIATEDGAPLAARPITIWSKAGGKWTPSGEVLSDPAGGFSHQAEITRNTSFAAVYGGDTAVWESQSLLAKVAVRPEVSLRIDGGAQDASGTYRFPNGTRRVTFQGDVSPDLSGRSLVIKIFRRDAAGETLLKKKKATIVSGSTYVTAFAPRAPGELYRIVARLPRGNGYAFARSPAIFFTVDP